MPPYCFDIATTESKWTLCAENQTNFHRWLKLVTHAVESDVAILPDEEHVFHVQPVPEFGSFPGPLKKISLTDYSLSIKVSAFGISLCIRDILHTNVPEKQICFWTYVDLYKWSLMDLEGQAGKSFCFTYISLLGLHVMFSCLAFSVTVFEDETFTKKDQYIFLNKEPINLATTIEYFMEKFMTVMHVSLERSQETIKMEHDSNSTTQDVTSLSNVDRNNLVSLLTIVETFSAFIYDVYVYLYSCCYKLQRMVMSLLYRNSSKQKKSI
jgi:hypothetical protein